MAKLIDNRSIVWYNAPCVWQLLRREQHGGIAQLARAFGSYPKCPRFESRCRYQGDAAPAASHLRPVGQVVKTPPFHGGNMGSNPVRVTIYRGLAQLVRAPASHAGGQQFESASLYQKDTTLVVSFFLRSGGLLLQSARATMRPSVERKVAF